MPTKYDVSFELSTKCGNGPTHTAEDTISPLQDIGEAFKQFLWVHVPTTKEVLDRVDPPRVDALRVNLSRNKGRARSVTHFETKEYVFKVVTIVKRHVPITEEMVRAGTQELFEHMEAETEDLETVVTEIYERMQEAS